MDKFEKKCKVWINALFIAGMLLSCSPTMSDRFPHFYATATFNIISQTDLPQSAVPDIHLPANTSAQPDGFSISAITPDIESRIRGLSYPESCPLSLDELRYLNVLYIGFDGLSHRGELIVHRDIASTVLELFYQLYESRYLIEKIRLIDEYGADDEASMADNNTSAFCWRNIAGTDALSFHSYGLAIDINPLYNPYIFNEIVSPKSSPYDRETGTVFSPYFMTADDLCVQLFKSYGFIWGGDWESPKDYQHFEYSSAHR